MLTLNYKYRLCPTPEQAQVLGRTMFFVWRGWNHLVRATWKAQRRMKAGHRATLINDVVESKLGKKRTGKRAKKLNALISSGLEPDQAMRELDQNSVQEVWQYRGSKVSVEHAIAKAERCKQRMVRGLWGTAWAQLNKKYLEAWDACWKRKRKAPRKAAPQNATWLQAQIHNCRAPLLHAMPQGAFRENLVSVVPFLPPSLKKNPLFARVRLLQHRPLPAGAKVKDIKITRSSIRPDAVWHVIFAAEVPDEEGQKHYGCTDLACGIDPGRTMAITLVGQDAQQPGIDGEEHSPGAPYARSLRKLRRLQRRLDRQRRANNPHCFSADGTWIRGQRLTHFSKNMRDTEREIAALSAHIAGVRKDYYSKLTDTILNRYDTVFIGNWSDGTPQAKGLAKRKRKEEFKRTGTKRTKGAAAMQRTSNRNDRDNALGIFGALLKEKAQRSETPKQIVKTSEVNTTRSCIHCAALSGPTGLHGLKIRGKWKCSDCGGEQFRDRGAAWNILQAGIASQAAGQAVTGGSNKSSIARTRQKRKGVSNASRSGRDASNGPNSRSKSDRVSNARASGKVMANSREALAPPQRIHAQSDPVVPAEMDRGDSTCATHSLAKGRGSPGKLNVYKNGSRRGLESG